MVTTEGFDEAERAQEAARLNEARLTLLDPERRADALVTLLGGPRRDEEKGLSPAFLMEIMETRQELEGAQAAGDEAELARLREWADAQREAYARRVGERFAEAGQTPDTAQRREIRLLLNEWRYIERMIEQSAHG